MENQNPPYDIFISYAWADNAKNWLQAFQLKLQTHYHNLFPQEPELKIFFDQNEIKTGENWQHSLTNSVGQSTLFLAFLSPAYFQRENCRKEWLAFQPREIQIHLFSRGIRPLAITPLKDLPQSDPDPAINQLIQSALALQINQAFTHKTLNTPAAAKAFDALAKDIHAQITRHKAFLQSDNTVPSCTRHFTGRADEFKKLRQAFTNASSMVITGIHGLGGMGKTELAHAYAQGAAPDYPGGRFIIRCDNRPSLREALLGQESFLLKFTIPEQQRLSPETYYAALLEHLDARLREKGPVLLVLDNISDPALLTHQSLAPLKALGARLHLLATTRLPAPANDANWLSLDCLPEEDALILLQKHTPINGEPELAAAKKLIHNLGGFTLAIELVAAWMAGNNKTYAAVADHIGLEAIKKMEGDESINLNHERNLTAILETVLDGLKPEHVRAMEYAAFLPPDAVALPWLKDLVGADFPAVLESDPLFDPWDMLVTELKRSSLFTVGEGDDFHLVRVHRLIQLAIEGQMGDAEIEELQDAIHNLLSRRLQILEVTTDWPNDRWELMPIDATAWLWEGQNHPQTVWLFRWAGSLFKIIANWNAAEPLLLRALAVTEDKFGSDHIETANDLRELAGLLQRTNRFAPAEPLIRRALLIFEKSFGKDHPHVAVLLNNLASLLQNTNRIAEAEPLMRLALEIDEKSLGNHDPTIAIRLNNLALLLQDTNRVAEAEPLVRRALAIDEKSLGKVHPNVARDLNTLAALLQNTNRLIEAEPLLRRALEIYEKCFGDDHPHVALTLNNLANLLQNTNRLGEAEPLMRRALEIDEKSFGKDHPRVATRLSNLAALFRLTNRLAEAEPLIRRALAIDEKSLEKDNPNAALRLNNVAQLLQDSNRLAEAEPLMRKALEIDEKSLGKDHPAVARDLCNLARLLHVTKRLAEAEPLMRQAMEINEKSFGKDHPAVARDLNNLALLLQDSNRLAEAEPLMWQALEIDEKSLGRDHPTVARDLNNLAGLFRLSNRLAEAEPLIREALEIFITSSKASGHRLSGFELFRSNYHNILIATGKTEQEADAIIHQMAPDLFP